MVNVLWVVIFGSLGMLAYLLPAIVGPALSIEWRKRIGTFYYKQSMRSYRRLAFVRRLLGSYSLLPISTNDEQRLAQVTLDSGVLGDDKQLAFSDPAECIKRLYGKPVSVNIEDVPAATSPGLAEKGHWVEEHDFQRGLVRDGKPDPYVRASSDLRFVDPLSTRPLVCKGTRPETIQTTEQLTRKRFQKYGSNIGAVETLATLTGFGVGAAGVAGIQYVRERVLDSGGGGSAPDPNPIPADVADVDAFASIGHAALTVADQALAIAINGGISL